MVGVIAHQRGEVERHREAGLAALQQELVAAVGILGRAEARELPHGPEAAAVHALVDAAREGEFAGAPQLPRPVESFEVHPCVYRFFLDAHRVAPLFTWARISPATA